MSIQSQIRASAASLARRLIAWLTTLVFAMLAIAAADAAEIEIVSVRGDVRVTTAGTEKPAKAGTMLALPSTVRTGKDGTVDLRQGETTIGIGPGSELEFPAAAQPDAPVERIVQPLGNAFYNVGPLGKHRLRVETPYLVAVIKGTQFNVAVEPGGATISLHEGSLEVLATDSGETTLLDAGEVAMRHHGDEAIRVIPMRKDGTAAAGTKDHATRKPATADVKHPAVPAKIDGTRTTIGDVEPPRSEPVKAIAPVDDGQLTLETEIDSGGPVGTKLDTEVESGTGTVETGVDVDLGGGAVDAGVDAALDSGAGAMDTDVDLDVDVGPIDADVGADLAGGDAGIDAGLEVLDTGIEVGLGGDAGLIDVETTSETSSDGPLGGVLQRPGH